MAGAAHVAAGRENTKSGTARLPDPGEVAQLVEHTAENRGVAGSIPALAIDIARSKRRRNEPVGARGLLRRSRAPAQVPAENPAVF
jgi:hypothetical protein